MSSPHNRNSAKEVAITIGLILGLFVGLITWMVTDVESAALRTLEDDVVENITSLLFLLSGVGFLIVLTRSQFLKSKSSLFAYAMTLAWALLMLVFAGEEISWGQRIFNFETPQGLSEINKQQEFNIHNVEWVDTFMGGKYRWLTVMMLTTGLLLPLMALTRFGRQQIQWFAFPVPPLRYMLLFVGAYALGKYFRVYELVNPNGKSAHYVADEMRELIMAVGMVCFAFHGVLRPDSLYRAEDEGGTS